MVGQSDWLPMMMATGLADMRAFRLAMLGRKGADLSGWGGRGKRIRFVNHIGPIVNGNSSAVRDHEGEPGQVQGNAGARARSRRTSGPRRRRALRVPARP